ncbi:MAG: hypothetical protein Q8O93_03765 [bacterium]|nr:hypothetical protein [bacterium]
MPKKYIIKIIIALALIIAAGGFWYVKYYKNTGNNDQNKIAFITGFVLLDDEAGLVNSESVELAPAVREQFEKKAEEARADLITAEDKEARLAGYNNLGLYQKYLGNYRQSYDAYLESLALENQARVTWQNFADVLLKMKAYKSAEMAYKKAVEINKYIPESYVKLAGYYQTIGDDAQAEATYKSALDTIKESTESDALVLNGYANWLIAKNRVDEAIEILEELIIKQPGNKEAIERRIEELKK